MGGADGRQQLRRVYCAVTLPAADVLDATLLIAHVADAAGADDTDGRRSLEPAGAVEAVAADAVAGGVDGATVVAGAPVALGSPHVIRF